MSIIYCEVRSVLCTCKNGNCPYSGTAVIEEVGKEPIKETVKERKVNRDPGNIKRPKK